MKKLFSLILVLAMISTISACSEKETDAKDENKVVSISSAEFSYQMITTYANLCSLVKSYEQNYGYSPLGFDPDVSPEKQKYSDEESSEETNSEYNTWLDYIIDTAYCGIQERKAICAQAEKEGYKLDSEGEKKIDNLINNMTETYHLDDKGVNIDFFLKQSYGEEMTTELFRQIQREAVIAEEYEAYKTKLYYNSYTSEDLRKIYEKDTEDYGTVGIAVYPIEYTAKNKDNAKNNAENILSEMTDPESVRRIINTAENKKAKLYSAALGSDLDFYDSTEKFKNWAFNSQRKVGDKKIVEGDNAFYAVYLTKTVYDTYAYNSRHILLTFDDKKEATAESWKSLLSKAEKILDEWNSGKADEEYFANLAKKYSEDTGSNTNGGLYENTRPDFFVKEYESWCLDSKRKYGDVGMVKVDGTRYKGYHIIFFISKNETPVWENQLRTAKSTEDYQKFSLKIFSNECSKYTIDNTLLNSCIKNSIERINTIIKQNTTEK